MPLYKAFKNVGMIAFVSLAKLNTSLNFKAIAEIFKKEEVCFFFFIALNTQLKSILRIIALIVFILYSFLVSIFQISMFMLLQTSVRTTQDCTDL